MQIHTEAKIASLGLALPAPGAPKVHIEETYRSCLAPIHENACALQGSYVPVTRIGYFILAARGAYDFYAFVFCRLSVAVFEQATFCLRLVTFLSVQTEGFLLFLFLIRPMQNCNYCPSPS